MRRASRQRHFMHGIFDGFDGFLHRVELDRAGLGVHVRDVILVGAIVLPSGDQHGVLHRVQHDLRVDAFFLAQYLDGLKNRVQSALFVSFQICAGNIVRRRAYHSNFRLAFCTCSNGNSTGLARFGFERDDAVLHSPARVPSQLRRPSTGSRR